VSQLSEHGLDMRRIRRGSLPNQRKRLVRHGPRKKRTLDPQQLKQWLHRRERIKRRLRDRVHKLGADVRQLRKSVAIRSEQPCVAYLPAMVDQLGSGYSEACRDGVSYARHLPVTRIPDFRKLRPGTHETRPEPGIRLLERDSHPFDERGQRRH
jgi:hypothetical protein